MAVTDYLRGAGTSADPYIIHNIAAWTQFFNVDKNSGKYFEIVNDIDCGGITLTGIDYFKGGINGNGNKVSNFKTSSSYWFNSSTTSAVAEICNIHVVAKYSGTKYPLGSSTSFKMTVTNVRVDIEITSTGTLFYALDLASSKFDNFIVTYLGSARLSHFTSSNSLPNCYIYAPNTSDFNITGVNKITEANKFLPDSYMTLGSEWIIDSVSFPYLAKNGVHSLTQKYAIKGSTKVGGIAKKRKIAVLTAAYLGVLKNVYTADDGTYLIDMVDTYDPVYVMHYDDYGFPLAANTSYTLGLYIHPKTPNGYRYKCTTAGTSGATLPAEPWATSSNLTTGTAIFYPEPVYKTETFLVSPHLYDFLTGQPV